MRRCEPQAAEKRFSTRTKKTKERSLFTRPPGIDATVPCGESDFRGVHLREPRLVKPL